jgi:hypothetical protein
VIHVARKITPSQLTTPITHAGSFLTYIPPHHHSLSVLFHTAADA